MRGNLNSASGERRLQKHPGQQSVRTSGATCHTRGTSYKHPVPRGAEVTLRSRAAPASAPPLPAGPSAARSPADGHGPFKRGKRKASGDRQHAVSVRKLRLPCSGRAVGAQIQGCNTRASFCAPSQCGARRKEDGWPLAAPGLPAGPRALPPLPCPRGGGPGGLSLSRPRPGPHHPAALHPKTAPSLENTVLPHCSAGKGGTGVFLVFFQMKDDGPIWKRKGTW